MLKITWWQILLNAVEAKKKRGIRAIDGFRKKFMTPDNEISVCPEHEVKSIIGTIFVNVDILEGYSVKIYEIDPYFCEHYNKKIQSDKVIKMDVHTYYLELMFSSRNWWKRSYRQRPYFSKKNTLEKKLNCVFISVDASRKNYDASYEASTIQTFINNSIKNKIKELEDEIQKLRLQLASPNNDNDKK